MLRRHARRAGLKAQMITTRTLRHTAAMRWAEVGESPEAVGARLGMKRMDLMKAYLGRLAEKPRGRLRARKRVDSEIWPGLPPLLTGEAFRPTRPPGSEQVPARGPFRAWPGNHLSLGHGLSAKYLPELEWLAEQGVELHWTDWVILRWRIVMQRVMIVGRDVKTLDEGIRLLKVLGIASARLVKAFKARQELREAEVDALWESLGGGRPGNRKGRKRRY